MEIEIPASEITSIVRRSTGAGNRRRGIEIRDSAKTSLRGRGERRPVWGGGGGWCGFFGGVL